MALTPLSSRRKYGSSPKPQHLRSLGAQRWLKQVVKTDANIKTFFKGSKNYTFGNSTIGGPQIEVEIPFKEEVPDQDFTFLLSGLTTKNMINEGQGQYKTDSGARGANCLMIYS